VTGYLLGAIGKPMIALSGAWWHVLGARFVDRFDKGLRTAPRDALIAENSDASQRGRAFGFHRSMDTVGAVLGPLIGFLFLNHFAQGPETDRFRQLYWLAFIPGLIGVVLLAVFVREKRGVPEVTTTRPAIASFATISPEYKRYLLIVGLFSLGNSSDTFLLLRARDMGMPVTQMLLLYALFNVVEASLGYFAGGLSDRVGRRPLVAAGYGVFAVVYLGFALLNGVWAVWLLFVLYGFYYTLTQGVQRALAADLAHPERRATEIGLFHMVVGLAALPASIGAGWLYDVWQPAPFILGACTAAAAAMLVLLSLPLRHKV
jgi:MFS family permease